MSAVSDRFWSKVDHDPDDECWLWKGGVNPGGYGRFCNGGGGYVMAHRWSYQELRGEIPDALVIDHLCRVRNCVNPWHMEPVTIAENVRRGYHPESDKTHCPKNHPYDDVNTYWTNDGHRECKACRKASQQRYHEKNPDATRQWRERARARAQQQ